MLLLHLHPTSDPLLLKTHQKPLQSSGSEAASVKPSPMTVCLSHSLLSQGCLPTDLTREQSCCQLSLSASCLRLQVNQSKGPSVRPTSALDSSECRPAMLATWPRRSIEAFLKQQPWLSKQRNEAFRHTHGRHLYASRRTSRRRSRRVLADLCQGQHRPNNLCARQHLARCLQKAGI